jgi:hypothetical protein
MLDGKKGYTKAMDGRGVVGARGSVYEEQSLMKSPRRK